MKKNITTGSVELAINNLIFLLIFVFLSCCTNNEKREIARQKSETLMDEIGDGNAEKEFPEKYFPAKQIEHLLGVLKDSCDFKNRRGNFVNDWYQTTTGGVDKVAFIYEYYLRGDSLRFIVSYSLGDPIELYSIRLEKLWDKNPMVIYKDRQLKY